MKIASIIYVLLLSAIGLQAQVEFYIQAPSPLAGTFNITYVGAETGTTDWSSPNMDNPANVIIGELTMAIDSTEADSLLCEAVINTDEIAGKIAVFYRGDCNYSTKLLAAENAGAIAGLIINHSGEPVGMGGGVDGMNVSIPMAMISTADGAALRDAIEEGGLIAFFGNRTGLYNNDLGINASTVLRPPYYSQKQFLINSDNLMQIGAKIINYGINNQTNVSLSCVITFNGDSVYNEISNTPVDINSGDTIHFDLPQFNYDPYSYMENYYISYEIVYSEDDEFKYDNSHDIDFWLNGNFISYARIDQETGDTPNKVYKRPDVDYGEIRTCVAFKIEYYDFPLVLYGLTFSANTLGDNILGEELDAIVYNWNIEFDDFDDPNFDLSDAVLEELASEHYEYVEELDSVNIYLQFENTIYLWSDSERYLVCISYTSEYLQLGYDNQSMDYAQNLLFYNQPMFPQYIEDSEQLWFATSWTTPNVLKTNHVPAIAFEIIGVGSVNDKSQSFEITPFPNPAVNQVNIPIGNHFGKTKIDIYDIAGKQVKSLNLTSTSLETIKVNVSNFDNGVYLFKMLFEDGSYSNFNVVVNNH